jgi:glycosyltransferase involved in cell wall biosynthesis
MNKNYPLVSLIITSYNRASLISKAIESSLEQDYPNLEIIISDNCSTDNTEEVVKKYLADPRIKYFRNNENLGMLGNFRKATYKYAKGDFITYVNSDDYLIGKTYITDAIKIALSDNSINIVWGRMGVKNTSTDFLWEIPERPFFVKSVWDGKEVFFSKETTVLLSWGACLMRKESMLQVKTFHAEYFNFDTESNYKILLLGKAAFINHLYYIQVEHDGNNGFPADADKIMNSLECYESIGSFALEVHPERDTEVLIWKENSIYRVISWAFHSLSVRNKSEYEKFCQKSRFTYPSLYQKFTASKEYKRMLVVNRLRKFLPQGITNYINRVRHRLVK